jgi:RimJ/RimL family protein N-acetyltransferase
MYGYRNDPEVAHWLGGFSFGFSRRDFEDWIERHRNRTDEIIWVIAAKPSDECIGHVGLYEIDYRAGKAEYAMCIGDKAKRARGLGTEISKAVHRYAFRELNLHKVHAEMLDFNEAAIKLCERLGYKLEGRLRANQFRDGKYVDSLVMSVLVEEWESAHGAD